jgi:hypothetical protein
MLSFLAVDMGMSLERLISGCYAKDTHAVVRELSISFVVGYMHPMGIWVRSEATALLRCLHLWIPRVKPSRSGENPSTAIVCATDGCVRYVGRVRKRSARTEPPDNGVE